MATTVKVIDPLDHLEERIQKAVALVHRLRDDNEAALKSAAEDRELFAMEKADAAKDAFLFFAELKLDDNFIEDAAADGEAEGGRNHGHETTEEQPPRRLIIVRHIVSMPVE